LAVEVIYPQGTINRSNTEEADMARISQGHGGLLARVAVGTSLVLGIAACGQSTTTASGPVNVGVPAGYSGTTIIYGTPWFDGVQTAVNYINKYGGADGHKIHLIPVNTASDPVDAVTAIRQMLAADNIVLSIGLAALDWTDALPILNQQKMVSFTHIGSPAIDKLNMPYSYSTGPSDAVEGAAVAEYASSKGYHNVAVVFDASQSAQTLVPSLTHAAGVLGMNVVAQPSIPVGAPSYEAEVQQIINSHPDAILLQLDPGTSGTFFPELRALGGANIPIIATDVSLDPNWVKAVGASYYAAHVTSIEAATQATGPGLATFNSGFEAQYHKAAAFLSIYGYDGMTVAALAMDEAKSTDPSVYYSHVLDVTTPGPGITNVYTYQQGEALLAQGKKIKYVGVGSPDTYNQFHRVSATFAAEQLQPDGTVTLIQNIPAASLQPLL
jgi:branched-chain amino acid transport system substrate-binding protein